MFLLLLALIQFTILESMGTLNQPLNLRHPLTSFTGTAPPTTLFKLLPKHLVALTTALVMAVATPQINAFATPTTEDPIALLQFERPLLTSGPS